MSLSGPDADKGDDTRRSVDTFSKVVSVIIPPPDIKGT
jgi:hypothetical protein